MEKRKKGIENPGKVLKRVMAYVLKNYKFSCIVVVIGIIVATLANIQGTMFMQTLIDDYITPLTKAENPDFSGLMYAIFKVAAIYAVGVICTYVYNRIMVNVTQGTLKNLRNDMFLTMESLPIKYFDTHAHGDIMSCYTNDIDTLRQMISQSIPQLINSALMIVSVVVCMIRLNIPLTLATFVMVAFMLLVTKKLAGLSGKYFARQQKDIGSVNAHIDERTEGGKGLLP